MWKHAALCFTKIQLGHLGNVRKVHLYAVLVFIDIPRHLHKMAGSQQTRLDCAETNEAVRIPRGTQPQWERVPSWSVAISPKGVA